MAQFRGFPQGKTRLTPVPSVFFSELLPEIDDLQELRVSLYVFWRLDHMEGAFRYLRRSDFVQDTRFMAALGTPLEEAQVALDEALERAVRRGTLLKAALLLENGEESFYFLNSPKGRAALQAIERGAWRPSENALLPVEFITEAPNIFRLYEEHIGPLTPMIAEALRDAENTYPARWIEEAIRIAVESNKRSWRYASAILNRWQQEGRDERQDRQDSEKDRRRYIEGEFSDFIEH
jgi:DnaD/phage-associated family protein